MIETEEGIEGLTLDKKSKIILPNSLNTNRVVRARVLGVGLRVSKDIKEGDIVLLQLLSGKKLFGQNYVHEDIIYLKEE